MNGHIRPNRRHFICPISEFVFLKHDRPVEREEEEEETSLVWEGMMREK